MIKFIGVLALFLSFSVMSAPTEKFAHVFYGAGEIYSTPASFRIGRQDWEIGLFNQRSLGFTKLIYKDDYYAAAGLIVNQNSMPGIFGGLGWETYFWKVFSFRAEANTSYGFDNYSHSEIILGLTLYW